MDGLPKTSFGIEATLSFTDELRGLVVVDQVRFCFIMQFGEDSDNPMPHVELTMTPEQMASLLDTALRNPHPAMFLDMATTTFRFIGRNVDGITAIWLGWLYDQGEMEILMGLRAAWRRGEAKSPSEAARRSVMFDL